MPGSSSKTICTISGGSGAAARNALTVARQQARIVGE
jgi:hypothetical protein